MATASTSFSTMSGATLDFDTLLKSHAYISYLKTQRRSCCFIPTNKNSKIKNFLRQGTDSEYESLVFDISWQNARFELQDPDYVLPENDVRDLTSVHETWEYKNSVSNFEVTNEHENKTKAVLSLTWTQGKTSGLDLNASLKLPDEAREVFGESTVLNVNGPFETYHDQPWKFIVKVPVPENQAAKLVTVIHEKSYKGTFSTGAFLGGRVTVTILKNGKVLQIISDDVIDVWNKMKRAMETIKYIKNANSIVAKLAPFETLSGEIRQMIWKISGECHFTVGTHGSVEVVPA